jgi:hypothetical protein
MYRAGFEIGRRGQRRFKAPRFRSVNHVDNRDLARRHVGSAADAALIGRLIQMVRVSCRERRRRNAEHGSERQKNGDNPHVARHSHLT